MSLVFKRVLVRAAVLGLMLFAFGLTTVQLALAQSGSPQAFVEAIYKPYLKKGFKGIPYSSATALRRYFEPKLAVAMIKDMNMSAKRKEVGTLDGDPFIDAQDWEISNLAIDVKTNGNKANAIVTFTNLGKPSTISLDLVKTAAGWRIADILAPSGSLRALFKVK